MSRSSGAADWEWLLYDVVPATAPPGIPPRLRLQAAWRTARALWLLRRHSWPEARGYLERLRPGAGAAGNAALPPETAVRLARREIFACQLIVRSLAPTGRCLVRSLALATYLRALGLPAELTLARTRSCGQARNRFHSWTELYGTVLNEKQDILLAFSVLQRVPAGAGPPPRRPEPAIGAPPSRTSR